MMKLRYFLLQAPWRGNAYWVYYCVSPVPGKSFYVRATSPRMRQPSEIGMEHLTRMLQGMPQMYGEVLPCRLRKEIGCSVLKPEE